MPRPSPARFDLAAAVAAWRRQLMTRRAIGSDDVDELETHLFDEIDELRAGGQSEEEAFHEALRRLGTLDTIEGAYRDVFWAKLAGEGGLLHELHWRLSMLRTHLTIGLRHLKRRPLYGFINVFGLAVGLGACLLIALYARYEFSFDTYHEKSDRLYRLVEYSGFGEKGWGTYVQGDPVAAMRERFPDVENAVKLSRCGNDRVTVGGETFRDIRMHCTDGAVFDLFSFGLIQGDPETVLEAPGTAVITRSLARRLFGDADPMGRTLPVRFYHLDQSIEITGVMEDVPRNTHFTADLFISYASLEPLARDGHCLSCGQPMYALLAPGADTAAVADRLLHHIREVDGKERVEDVRLEPITAIHFSDVLAERQGDRRYLSVLSAIALAVLLIACANYMNLATARYAQRMREVGVRKALGAHRGEIARQFLFEALLVTLLALPLAVILVALTLPGFNMLANTEVTLGGADVGVLLSAALVLLVVVSFITGSYPAFFLSAFRPADVLRGRMEAGLTAAGLRKGLVVFQFSITVVMIALTFVILQQLDYMQTKKLGFDHEQVVVVNLSDRQLSAQAAPVKEAFLRVPAVAAASAGGAAPGQFRFGMMRFVHTPDEGGSQSFVKVGIDEDFLETMRIRLLAGRDLASMAPDAKEEGVLVNEATVQAMGWTSPEAAVGQTIEWMRVVGVVEDFHYKPLHVAVDPLILSPPQGGSASAITLRLAPGDLPATLAALERTWKEDLGATEPFEYTFLDDDLAALYDEERRVAKVFGVFAGLSILIACLGLLGLATFTAERRTKEIGIRKVLGASAQSIVTLLFREFALLLLIAIVVAVPVVYLAGGRWLEGFAYRIDMSPLVLVAAGALVLVVAFAAVAAQSARAALRNPVESLRYE